MKPIDDRRDKPLSCHWNVKYSALRELVPLLPENLSERMERVVASIVAEAMIVAAAAPSREDCQRISYSRRKTFYAAAKRYMGHDYSYAYVVAAVDMLVKRGVLSDHLKAKGGNFKPRKEGEPIRYQSSFRPGDCLFGLKLPEIARRKAESIRLKDSQGNLIDFRETERVRREKAFLDEVNRIIGSAQIQLDVAGAVEAGMLIHFPARSDRKAGYAVNRSMISLYRVFNGGWTLGGRMYGGWWQAVGKEHRKAFVINGSRVHEEDYSQIHPRLLYIMAGEELGDRDAYTIPGYENHRDTLCKTAWNILVNAPTHMSALLAISGKMALSRKEAADLIRAIKVAHPKIARFFHSGIGIRLQYFDSEIAKTVLAEMTVKRGIVVLPVFDSFIVREEDRDTLVTVMKEAFDRHVPIVRNSRFRTGASGRKGPQTLPALPARAALSGPASPVPASPSLPACLAGSEYDSGAAAGGHLVDDGDWASAEMDALYGTRDVDDIEHGQGTATDRDDDDPQVGLLRAQELIVRPARQEPETEPHEASPTQDGLKQDLSTAPATGLMNSVTEGTAPMTSSEGPTAAKHKRHVHSPVRGSWTAQMVVQEPSTVPSIPARHPVVNRRPPPAFILQVERQAAAEYQAMVSSRPRRDGRWEA